MEPKRFIKKYYFNGFDYKKELDRILNQYFSSRGNNVRVGDWVVVSPKVVEVLNNLENEHRG